MSAGTSALSHFNAQGQAHMVDVSNKTPTQRIAIARGQLKMQPATLALVAQGEHQKGDVLGVARIAAIQAAKKTADLIPLCHSLPLTHIAIDFELNSEQSTVNCQARVETLARTGVEMEALMAVHIGLLTVYDMCKAVDKTMVMHNIQVIEKRGGKTDFCISSSLSSS